MLANLLSCEAESSFLISWHLIVYRCAILHGGAFQIIIRLSRNILNMKKSRLFSKLRNLLVIILCAVEILRAV